MKLTAISNAIRVQYGLTRRQRPRLSILIYALAGGPCLSIHV
jgi:hypothetical protein